MLVEEGGNIVEQEDVMVGKETFGEEKTAYRIPGNFRSMYISQL